MLKDEALTLTNEKGMFPVDLAYEAKHYGVFHCLLNLMKFGEKKLINQEKKPVDLNKQPKKNNKSNFSQQNKVNETCESNVQKKEDEEWRFCCRLHEYCKESIRTNTK